MSIYINIMYFRDEIGGKQGGCDMETRADKT